MEREKVMENAYRRHVAGGWLLEIMSDTGNGFYYRMVFIDDPEHEWEL